MDWLARNASTIVVLLILIVIVAAIIRSMVKSRSIGGCSGDCTSCGTVCSAPKIKLTPEQEEQLRQIRQTGEQAGAEKPAGQGEPN